MSDDRRAEIRALADELWMMRTRGMAEGTTTWASMGAGAEQLRLLVCEVEEMSAELVAVRAALQGLYDATFLDPDHDGAYYYNREVIEAARTIAGRILTKDSDTAVCDD